MPIKFNKFLRWPYFLALCLIALLIAIKVSWLKHPIKPLYTNTSKQRISNIGSNAQSDSKKHRWQNMEKEVASWGDALGKGIDPGIKKMIVALNLLNFKTEQSCEGHIDWGRPYPWVSISTKTSELNELTNKRKKIFSLIREQQTKIQKKHPDLSLGEALRKELPQELRETYKKKHLLNHKIEKVSRLTVIQLRNLIIAFYKKHPIDPDKMLALSMRGSDWCELSSLGGDWQSTRNKSEKLKKLQEYQQEMNLFTDFLSDYYFNEKSI